MRRGGSSVKNIFDTNHVIFQSEYLAVFLPDSFDERVNHVMQSHTAELDVVMVVIFDGQV